MNKPNLSTEEVANVLFTAFYECEKQKAYKLGIELSFEDFQKSMTADIKFLTAQEMAQVLEANGYKLKKIGRESVESEVDAMPNRLKVELGSFHSRFTTPEQIEEDHKFQDEMLRHLESTNDKGCGQSGCIYCNTYWEMMRDAEGR